MLKRRVQYRPSPTFLKFSRPSTTIMYANVLVYDHSSIPSTTREIRNPDAGQHQTFDYPVIIRVQCALYFYTNRCDVKNSRHIVKYDLKNAI